MKQYVLPEYHMYVVFMARHYAIAVFGLVTSLRLGIEGLFMAFRDPERMYAMTSPSAEWIAIFAFALVCSAGMYMYVYWKQMELFREFYFNEDDSVFQDGKLLAEVAEDEPIIPESKIMEARIKPKTKVAEKEKELRQIPLNRARSSTFIEV